MADMLVKLYNVEENPALYAELGEKGIQIKRALGMDTTKILEFIAEQFHQGWVDECRVALMRQPSTCYIAVKKKRVVGFCCYDATCRDFIGPVGVHEAERSLGIGEALLRKTMISMREDGYAYAIIGWVAEKAIPLYQRCFQASLIPDSYPGIYANMVEAEENEMLFI